MAVSRFQPDRGFSGADQAPTRDGPVQFEKDTEEDPFGLNKFLTEAKKAKRPAADRYGHSSPTYRIICRLAYKLKFVIIVVEFNV